MSSSARMMGPVFQQIGSAMERLTVLMGQKRGHAVSVQGVDHTILLCSTIDQANKADRTGVKMLTSSILLRHFVIVARLSSLYFQQHHPMFVASYHQLRQLSSPNLCLSRPVSCSHICVPAPATLHSAVPASTCLCPRQYST
jgi:hypothetical protein